MKKIICLIILVTISLSAQIKGKTGITFKLRNFRLVQHALPETDMKTLIVKKFGKTEAHSKNSSNMIDDARYHPFLLSVHYAFSSHRPLIIKPDHIWLLIVQGFATYVDNNQKKLRSMFVKHKGKAKLKVRRDDFIKGNKNNPWEEVFPEFCKQIGAHIGTQNLALITAKFSTTTPVEQAAFQITLMDAMKHYFEYHCYTLCGIPAITLEGTPQDWKNLLIRARKLKKYKLDWWIKSLEPILQEFINASEGNINKMFWKSIYKELNGSGGASMRGWISKFFPYIVDSSGEANIINPIFKYNYIRLRLNNFPYGISRAPFTWHYLTKEFKMEFLAGFIGVSHHKKTDRLKAEIGWVILDKSK